MEFISDPKTLKFRFCELLQGCQYVSFAVAWASNGFPCEELLKYQTKITVGLVGTHFYQTHPKFIEKFMGVNAVRFIESPQGLFHPKFYLFDNGEEEWSCLLGSANLTDAAFHRNHEACILITRSDDDSSDVRIDIERTLKRYSFSGSQFDGHRLAIYRERWGRAKRNLSSVTKGSDKEKTQTNILAPGVTFMSWRDFFSAVRNEQYFDARCAWLSEARALFETHGSLDRMSFEERKRIAGLVGAKADGPPVFGYSALPADKHILTKEPQQASAALDLIPIDRSQKVTKQIYEAFIDAFRAARPKTEGLVAPTRVLAMKRPDYFLCYNGQNKERLAELLGGVVLGTDDYAAYWDAVVEPITNSPYWNSPRPTDRDEAHVWDGRVAFLDSLCSEWSQQGNTTA